MFANWKSAIYEYAHRRNRLDSEGDAGDLVPVVRDDRFVRRLDGWMRRVRASREARQAETLRGETGLTIIGSDCSEEEAVVDLQLRRSTEYAQLGYKFREERLERERITVKKTGTKWIIASVEPLMSERRASPPPPPFEQTEAELTEGTAAALRSVPFLNYNVLPVAALEPAGRSSRYDRAKARRYAETWWNGANPKYMRFEVDCTNFVSQCLFAGGAPMNYTGKRESGWWYQGKDGSRELWSFSWAVAHSLQSFLASSQSGLRANVVAAPHRLAVGDVICYDWDGNGRYQHNTIVTGFDALGMPLVNAHTTDSRMRYWDYRDSYAWTPNTRYRFFHIADYF